MAGAPAAGTRGRRAIVHTSGLLEAFPEDRWAAEEHFDSYVGTYLFDEYGGRVGVLGVYSRDPIESPAIVRGIVRLFAARIAPSLRHLRAERDLRESEERYSALFEDSHLPIMLLDPDSTQILDANEAACTFYGHTHDDLTAMSILQITRLLPMTFVRNWRERSTAAATTSNSTTGSPTGRSVTSRSTRARSPSTDAACSTASSTT